jgi:DNA-binding transcriptional LysR family regulator
MDLVQLEHFLAVADERTFTRAAERVFRTQPALSQSIKKLETELGTSLFMRDNGDVSLTEAGSLLKDYAHRMLKLRDEAARSITQLQNLEIGTLTIAAHESAALYLLPNAILRFLQLFPDVKVCVKRARLQEIPHMVLDREVQIGFLKDAPAFQELGSADVHSDRMALIASPKHRLAEHTGVVLKDLDRVPFVVHHLCSSTEEVVLRLFRQNGIHCHVVAELWSFENVKSFVLENVGVAIVPRITVIEELRTGSLVEIGLPELSFHRGTVMTFRRDCSSEAAERLIEIMRSKYRRSVVTASKQRTPPLSERASYEIGSLSA